MRIGVEIIARDRSTDYARGATLGAPMAVQVADRWHILKNHREALERMLNRLHAPLSALPLPPPAPGDPAAPPVARRPRALRTPSAREQAAHAATRERGASRPTAQLTATDTATLARRMRHTDVVCAWTLAPAFQAMVRQRKPEGWDAWLKACTASGIPELPLFAKGLAQEQASIRAALSEPWSSGQVEGPVHRLKLLKRQMYARAKRDLRRPRVLHAA